MHLMHLAGIPIRLHWSFLALFAGFSVYALATGGPTALAATVVVGLALFTSVVLHELGHALAARHYGIGTDNITLYPFGGIAAITGMPKSARQELVIAIAGPAVNGALFLGAALLWGALGWRILLTVAALNLMMGLFNLIPAFPMDGGRIVRSIAWKITGKRGAATRFAAGLGRIFGFIFIGLGLVWALNGNVFSGLWLAMIGFLVNGSARAASRSTVSERLEGMTVGEVMDAEPVAIPGDLDCARAIEEYFLRFGWSWFPVVDETGAFIGMALRDRLEAVPEVERASTPVGSLAERDPALAVSRQAGLDTLLGNPQLRRFGALMVIDERGQLAGVITVEQLGRALRT